MAAVINTNVASLNAQRNLTMSQNSLATSLERLSSGLRINSAKDDAAGLAISERFTTQIRGLNQAGRNASDAVSLSQTAEGALGEVTNNLQRIRELAVQSANATNSSSDRGALDLEVQQRLAEIDRISSQTSFNGQKILDGTFGNAAFQVGANVGETISLDLSTSMKTNSIGAIATATSVDLDTLITAGSAAIAGSYTSGQLSSLDFSTAAASAVAGSDTVDFTGAFAAGSTAVVNGVTFTIVDSSTTQSDTDVIDATSVNVLVDIAGGETATDAAAAFDAALVFAKADANGDGTAGAFTTLTFANASGVTTISDSAAGSAATVSRTVTASAAAVVQDVTGSDAVVTSNLGFTIDGDAVAVNTDYSGNQAGLIAEIQADLDASNAGQYVVAADGAAGFSITTAVAGVANPATAASFTVNSITGDDGGTVVVGADLVATATFAVSGDFSIQLGTSTAVAVADATYTSAQQLVDAVNAALAGNATASLDADNVLTINSDETITITGGQGLTAITTSVNASTGDLTTVDVTDVTNSNDAIRRIDAALTSVSELRSTFGAIQNRFESTISNLSTTVENLSASRSRILDADFAAETANLTRAQILQQAGTAMLSQANSLPQNVLSLLG